MNVAAISRKVIGVCAVLVALSMLSAVATSTSADAREPDGREEAPAEKGPSNPKPTGPKPVGPLPIAPAQIIVEVDTGLATDSRCSLTEAILIANDSSLTNECGSGDPGFDEILLRPLPSMGGVFTYDEPYTPPSGPATDNAVPTITDDVAIRPHPSVAGQVTIRRFPTATTPTPSEFRLFEITVGNVTFEDLIMYGGDAPGRGGAIYVNQTWGDFAVRDSEFHSNHADAGSAIAATEATRVEIQRTVIRNNVGESGPALYIDANDTASLYEVAVMGNIAHAGGAGAFVRGNASAYITDSRFWANHGDRSVDTGGSFLSYPQSAALVVGAGPTGIVTLSNSEVTDNQARWGAAGVSAGVINGTVRIENTTISRNQADQVYPNPAYAEMASGLWVFGSNTDAWVTFTTITENDGGHGAAAAGLHVDDAIATLNLVGTIIAGNSHGLEHGGGPVLTELNVAAIQTTSTLNVTDSLIGQSENTTEEATGLVPGALPAGFVNSSSDGAAAAALDVILLPYDFLKHVGTSFASRSHRPGPASPALDAASCLAASVDQHQQPRSVVCDIGAQEVP